MNTSNPLTVTVEQAAGLLGISRSNAYRLVKAGSIPAVRLGHRWLVPLRKLEAMLDVDPKEEQAS